MENDFPRRNPTFLSLMLALALLVPPICLSNRPDSAAFGILLLLLLFFFPGYLLLTLLRIPAGATRVLLSFIAGICCITTAYSFFARETTVFACLVLILSAAGLLTFRREWRRAAAAGWKAEDRESVIAGALVAFAVAAVFWRSGRFSGSNFVLLGPAAQDPLFHVTLLQRLLHHVPADNFIVSGLRAPIYHYFDDLTLAFTLNAQRALHLGSTDIFDLYCRCYPTIIYFLLGALAYRIGRQLLGRKSGGVLSVLLLLGGGGLGCIPGILQALAHVARPSALRSSLFIEWGNWSGMDPILPLIHRPAHYHSLLICLGVLTLLLRSERTRRDWILSGLLLGLMAGFNFTLAATFGVATVFATVILWSRRALTETRDLAWLAVCTFLGSLPVTATMAFSGFHNETQGFPFRGPNLEFTTKMWEWLLRHFFPATLIPIAALVLFPIMAYGVRLAGVRDMFCFKLAGNRALAAVLAITFPISFVVGTFFPFKALGGIAVVFIQPTLGILALFSLVPLASWLQRNKWWSAALWTLLAVTWIQAIASFNFSREAVFSKDAASIFEEIQSASAPSDVVAFLPTGLTQKPLWGGVTETTNFSVTALTGLDGYFSSESYTTSFAVAGLQDKNEQAVLADAERLYQQRMQNVEEFLSGNYNDSLPRLEQDHVRWIVVSGDAIPSGPPAPATWRRSADLVVYRLP